MTRKRTALLAVTLVASVLAWPPLVVTSLIPVVGFVILPTLAGVSLFILYGATWLLYSTLAPEVALPYSPRRCYKVCLALLRWIREAFRLNIAAIATDWAYRRVLVLGSKGRETVIKENIPYGSGDKRLDIYLPIRRRNRAGSASSGDDGTDGDGAESPKVPVVVFIPGGGWAFADKRYYLQVALTLRKKGLMVIIPDVTLYPEGNAREMVSDIRLVLDWTARNAATYGGRSDSIYLMGHGSGAHLSFLAIVQEAVVRSRDAYWLSTFTKSKSLPQDAYSSDEDSPTSKRNQPPSHREGEMEISAGIRRLEIWGGETVEMPRIKGVILMAGVSDVIKHIRSEFKNGIEQISPLRRALGPSHAACLMASPSHLIYGAKQIVDTSFLPPNFLLIHGGQDRDIPIVQTVLAKTLLQGVGVRNVVLKAYKDLSHMECITALCGPKTSKYSGMILDEVVGVIAAAERQS